MRNERRLSDSPQALGRRRAGHVLELIQGAPHERFLLEGEELVLGRGARAQLKIAATELSPRHLILRAREDEYVCEDLDSKAGVLLNGVRIHRAVLRDGDTLQLGSLVFVYFER